MGLREQASAGSETEIIAKSGAYRKPFTMQPIRFFAPGGGAGLPSDDFIVNIQAGVTLACAALGEAGASRMPASFGQSPLAQTLRTLPDCFSLMAKLDRDHGETAPLELADAPLLVESAMKCLMEMASWAGRFGMPQLEPDVMRATVGVGYWAMRHQVPIHTPEPVAHALGVLANSTHDKSETAAIVAMMQGVLEYVTPQLAADLERSNPERAFRILTINLAMAAIRTEDEAMMRYAFDRVAANLPDEAAGFFAEVAAAAADAMLPEMTQRLLVERVGKH